MKKLARQWLVPVVCSVFLACAPGIGNRTRVEPPEAPSNLPSESTGSEPAGASLGEEYSVNPEAAVPGSVTVERPIIAEPEEGNLPAVEEPPLETPSSELADLAADAPDIADIVPESEQASEEELALIDELNAISVPEDFELEETRQERLNNTKSELPVVLNSQVAQFINYFTGRRGKKTVVRTLERAGAYRDMIERILEEEGVPQEMFHLAQAESGFRPKARSRALATGMWQFMKFRGRQYGLRQDKYIDERYDPEKATRAAARHLLDLYIQFGDWYLAMAAYNGGPNRVQRAVERTKSYDFWTHSRRRLLRRETRNYVPIILAMTYVGKNLDMYGIEIKDPAPPLEYDTIETDSEIHLDLIADIAGTTSEAIKQLNPALLRSATPPYSYDLRLPKGSGKTFVSELRAIPKEKRLAWRRHKVQEGDSLAAIAKRYKIQRSQILVHNQVQDEGLAAGSWLTIPTPQRRLRYYRSSGGGAGGFLEPGTGRYRIARGDTLGGISQRFGTSIANLRNWNGLSSTRIIAGRYLIVKPEGVGANAASASSRPPLNSRMYRIASGDTLGTIARRFGVSVAQLKAWNGLSSNRIRAGDRLIVGEKPAPRPATSSRSTQTASSRSTGGSAAGPSEGGQYRIRRGDNLATIASRFGVTVEDLKRWNGLRSSRIREGKYLIVRPRSRTTASNSAASKSTSRTVANPISGSGERYRIRRGDNLALIARRFGVSVNDLKAWNGLRGTRITAGEYLIVSPERRNAASEAPVRAAARKEAATSARASTPTVHTIRRGDSLGAIAQRYGVTASELRRWNGIRGSRITAGDTLKVYPAVNFPGTERTVSASKRISTSAPPNGVYAIRRGDNLGDIAERFGVSVRNLQRWNGLNGTRITAGQTLIVSGTAAAKNGGGATTLEPTGKSRYRIRRGDTLAVIAKRFGVSVDDLKRWNGLRTTRIREGHYLTVSPGAKDGDGS